VILVDTSIWIDHLHRSEPQLVALLHEVQVCTHPLVIGELAMGSMKDRATVLALLGNLPGTAVATHDEVLTLVDRHRLHCLGLGVVDAHLLASLRLSDSVELWTRDGRLRTAATRLEVAARQLV
jgi:predicted nucleic acid-binding protein